MMQENVIRKFVDNILLNLGTISSSGLYNGEAGVALALFEVAKYLQDENIEEKAFDLLQKSLVRPPDDYGFENGLSGIGYVLIYSIRNKFIDADFNEIFKERYEETVRNFEDIDKQPDKLLNSLKVIYFLSALEDIQYEDMRIRSIIDKIFRGVELYLSLQFFDWKDVCYINNKPDVLQIYETYLKLVDFSGYTSFSNSLINSYIQLYREGRIVSLLPVGYYLHRIMKQKGITEYDDVINDNLNYGLININPEFYFLGEKLNLARIVENLDENSKIDRSLIDMNLLGGSLDKIKRMICPGFPLCSYQHGLARYLIFCVNKNAPLL